MLEWLHKLTSSVASLIPWTAGTIGGIYGSRLLSHPYPKDINDIVLLSGLVVLGVTAEIYRRWANEEFDYARARIARMSLRREGYEVLGREPKPPEGYNFLLMGVPSGLAKTLFGAVCGAGSYLLLNHFCKMGPEVCANLTTYANTFLQYVP